MEEKTPRRQRMIRVATLIVCALIFSSFLLIPAAVRPAAAAAQITDATIQGYEDRLKQLARDKAELATAISQATQEKQDKITYKNYLDTQLQLVVEELETIDALIEETEYKIGETQLDIIDKKAEVDELRQNFLDRLRITYEEGNTGYLELLLGAESLYDFLTRAERIGYMMDYNVTLMEECRDAIATLEEEENKLDAYVLLNQEKKASRDEKQAELEKTLTATNTELTTLQQEIYSNSTSYNKAAEEEEKINRELEEYIRKLQEKENAAYVGGEFIWPVDVSWKRISSNFGWRTLYGVREYHRGIDIPASAWSNIYASNNGTVIKAEWHWSYGNYVIIDHGGGKSTLYAHANQLNVKVGDKVTQGQVIAKVGTTGNSYGNHVHFEVRLNGVCQNPLDYVAQPK